MEKSALRDLNLSGVRWELTETPGKPKCSSNPIQQTFQENSHIKEKTIIVPPIAPINLDTVKSMVMRPSDIEALIRMVGEFNHPLKSSATNTVLPNIATNPNGLVIITDLPGIDDDLSGHILSGNAGEMTDKMLNAVEMSRDNVSIIPLLFWRTPGGRSPTRQELDLSIPFVNKMLEMLSPRVIITFGTLAATEIARINLNEAHGNEIRGENGCIIVPLYHPNYLILKPSAKRDVWNALQNIQKLLKNS